MFTLQRRICNVCYKI